MTTLLRRWLEIRTALRRFPLLDCILAEALIEWGAKAMLFPNAVVFSSHFGSLRASIGVVGPLVLAVGVGQFALAATRKERGRMLAGFAGLWVMISLWFSVDSATGKIAWRALAEGELLLCLALVP